MNPPLELLSGRLFLELASLLRQRISSVLSIWETHVRETLPKADELTLTQLRDDLPKVLEFIARALESDKKSETEALIRITEDHGKVRRHQSFNLDELIIEYSILRLVLTQEVLTYGGRTPTADEIIALNAAIDVTARQAVGAFTEQQGAELTAANEAQSKYLSFLSHDLRGGLNGVFLMIEVLKRELGGEAKFAETIEDLDIMRRTLLETVGTMDRFLYAERFRKGKVQVRPAPLSVRPLLSEVAAQFVYQARDKGLELTVEADDACKACSDRELVMMIVQNLVSNAVKYTSRGSIRMTATEDASGCVIAVHDQGPGIEPEKLSTLFSTFTRGDTHGQPGVGLGLSIAQQAARLLGADLSVESEVGRGSTFACRLPKRADEPKSPKAG